jgi:hypothetical protein
MMSQTLNLIFVDKKMLGVDDVVSSFVVVVALKIDV